MKISKVVGLFFLFLFISFLSACSEKHLIYIGESDNWSMRYEVFEPDENFNIDHTGTEGYIRYIGYEVTPQKIEYSISDTAGSVELDENGVFWLPRSSCNLCSKDTEFEAIIEWDDKLEIVMLRYLN